MKLPMLLAAAAFAACAASPPVGAGSHPYRFDLLGTPGSPAVARTVAIGPNTAHVNVVRNETITFHVSGKAFTWLFDGPLYVSSVELNRVAPPGLLDHPVIAYISPDPLVDTPSF
jgi:hypothetical protein